MYGFNISVLGCQMNVYDADRIRTALAAKGWEEVSEEDADVVVLVTCSIRDKAEQKAWSDIGRLASRREPPLIAVVGCMAQRVGTLLMRRFPSVRLVCGPRSLGKLPDALEKTMTSGKDIVLLDEDPLTLYDLPEVPLLRSNPWKAFITIAHGCDNFCTYCIVPHVRGRFISRDPDEIFREVESLISDGVREITLIGQNVNTYGRDFGNGYVFSSLLRDVAGIKGLERIRYATSHPRDLTRDVVEVMSEHENICPAINLPIQSGSDRVLGLMNRGYTVGQYCSIIDMIRSILPGPAVTSDLIVGFPGETSEDFKGSVRVVEDLRFDLVHTAAFSPREGTPAARMEAQVEAEEKQRRLRVINSIQSVISREINQGLVGKVFTVLADGNAPKGEGLLQGRTPTDKVVIFPGDLSMMGSFVDLRITAAGNWHLFGEPVPPSWYDRRE
ncbi:MAG: tRNA (N6-isopentenyl adenosine(37)-C2)-methylthiotransferase MiaB [Thermovirgaceae bacterium]|nr:tRNA (N6-isopentenyl adenosine(37)-C2)-methylthiotransferase MiaB [Synergistales bacterium]